MAANARAMRWRWKFCAASNGRQLPRPASWWWCALRRRSCAGWKRTKTRCAALYPVVARRAYCSRRATNMSAKDSMSAPRTEKDRLCAVCGKPQDAAFRPFCSKRCADLDLGKWLKGTYVIPGDEPADHPEGGVSDTDVEEN